MRLLGDGMEIVVFVNNPKGLQHESIWGDCTKVNWVFSSVSEILPANISWSTAVGHSRGNHILVLSDDDELGPDFDFQTLRDSFSLQSSASVLLQHSTISERRPKGKPRLRNAILFEEAHIDATNIFDLALRNKISQHVSLLIVDRDLMKLVGPYQDLGFSNGYFSDTLMNLKIINASKKISTLPGHWVIRRTGPHQGSSEFENELSVLNKVDFFTKQLLTIDTYVETLSKYGLRSDREQIYFQRANFVLGNVSRALRGTYGNRSALVFPALGLLCKALWRRNLTTRAIWKTLVLKFFGYKAEGKANEGKSLS